MEKRCHAFVGKSINECGGNVYGVNLHEIVDNHDKFFLVLEYTLEILHLKLFLPFEFENRVYNKPVLLEEITLMQIIGDEGETLSELLDFRTVKFKTRE